jgi:hypothetical protein
VRGELTIAPGSADERVLTCPSGSYPAGGGGLFAGDPAVGDHLTSSGPAAGGWLVGGYNGADAPRTFTLGVICVDAPPAPSGSARTRALQVRPASARRRRHPRVRRGPRGLRGRRGPTGPAGPPGPVGIPRSPLPVVTRSADLQVAAGAKGSGQVDCQGDELVIGGGAYFLPDRAPGDHVVESGPIRSEGGPVAPGNFQNGTGWTASARNGGSATRLLRIFAQCQ